MDSYPARSVDSTKARATRTGAACAAATAAAANDARKRACACARKRTRARAAPCRSADATPRFGPNAAALERACSAIHTPAIGGAAAKIGGPPPGALHRAYPHAPHPRAGVNPIPRSPN